MQANRSRDTTPELALRRALHALGLRYRVCAKPLPDMPRRMDIVFRPVKVAVEVHGCFWHGCPEHHRLPKSNRDYWVAKIARNRERDLAAAQVMSGRGWVLIEVWEHEQPQAAARRIAALVEERRAGRRS